jgi:hypothetical protein
MIIAIAEGDISAVLVKLHHLIRPRAPYLSVPRFPPTSLQPSKVVGVHVIHLKSRAQMSKLAPISAGDAYTVS